VSATVGLTCGCPAGIGPEVSAAAIASLDAAVASAELIWFAHRSVLLAGAAAAGVDATPTGDGVTIAGRQVRCEGGLPWEGTPGVPDDAALAIQRASIEASLAAAAEGRLGALYTAPIRKAALDGIDGRSWPGHTELLEARLGDGGEASMLFAGGPFLLALATVHVPLAEVAATLSTAKLHRCLLHLAQTAERLAGAQQQPVRLVVLGLNPHAGEGGRLGREEIELIGPAIASWSAPGVVVEGPVPADGFFAELGRGRAPPAGVLAMAHDQGLAPYKLLAHGAAVNLTAGLRVLRASPDHGTADAIAGQGVAEATSASAALALAARAALGGW
jgi:4-hydroxythreonine-4-phosphate dehydrogenase